MKKKIDKKHIEYLAKQIRNHQNAYYNKYPKISDEAFDALFDRLRALCPEHELLQSLGRDSSFFPKCNHIMPMGSLSKVNDDQGFFKWARENKVDYYSVQYKMDGASLELQYEKGTLVAAVTRGNGHVGDNIFMNCRKMNGVVRNLLQPLNCAVRAEVIMTHDIHKKHFSNKANCRNAANGLMKRKDGKGVEYLSLICYDIWFPVTPPSSIKISTERGKIALLKTLGFVTVEYKECITALEVCNYKREVEKKREELPFDIDGLVVKLPEWKKEDMYTLRPKRQIAFKFPSPYVISTLEDVEWSESGHLYTPVAILKPVQIAGTTVKRASLANHNRMRELDIKIGSEVMISKRGEIIPKIENVVYTPKSAKDIEFPKVCSTCGSVVKEEGSMIFCPNLKCKRRLLFRVTRWINIQGIDNWGEALLWKLVIDTEMVKKIGDLYRITVDMLLLLEKVAQPLAEKLLHSLHKKQSVRLSTLLASMGIDSVALLTGEKIVASGIKNWEMLTKTKKDDLEKIEGVGKVIANNICKAVEFLREEIEDLFTFVTIEESSYDQTVSFCFTGVLASFSRKEASKIVQDMGAIVKTSITKDLTYLVVADSTSQSTKTIKAKKLGVEIINEDDFKKIIQK